MDELPAVFALTSLGPRKAPTMATKAGVWIDHKQATIVLLSDAGHEIKKIAFDIGQPIPKKGGGRSKNTFTRNDFVAEDTRERKLASDRKDYYGDVLAALSGVSSVLIIGPGEAKKEICKLIQSKKVRRLAVELETADKMTDRQLAAKVSKHFDVASAGKSKTATGGKAKKTILGKAARPKGAAKSASGKRKKRAGK
jgi:hypothetical protein